MSLSADMLINADMASWAMVGYRLSMVVGSTSTSPTLSMSKRMASPLFFLNNSNASLEADNEAKYLTAN
jgi:hypothetical protein